MCDCARLGAHVVCEFVKIVLMHCLNIVAVTSLGVTVCSVCECSQDIQILLGFSVEVICLLFECNASI